MSDPTLAELDEQITKLADRAERIQERLTELHQKRAQILIDDTVATALGDAQNALHELIRQHRAHVAALCPGVHKPVQHRDGRPPWCSACQRTIDGIHLRDLQGGRR